MAWVPFHQELREGDKRGLPRATRFIFLELSLLARAGRGVIKLPRGMSDIDALHDILGGSRAEVEAALPILTEVPEGDENPEPMIRIEGPPGARRVAVPSWQTWCGTKETPDAVTARTRRHRDKTRAAHRSGNDTGTIRERRGNESGTVGNDDREEKSRVEESIARSSSAGSEPPDSWDHAACDVGHCGDAGLDWGQGGATDGADDCEPIGIADEPVKAKPAGKADIDAGTLSPAESAARDAVLSDPSLAPICQRPASLARDLVAAGPAVDVPREIRAAGAWLRANPKKAKKNGNAFLLNWICRTQERGVAVPSVGWRSNGPAPPPQQPKPPPIDEGQLFGFMDKLQRLKPGEVVR